MNRGIGLVSTVVGLALSLWASPVNAAVTLGQLAPGDPPDAHCTIGPVDLFNPTATDNSYVVPGAGTITSWSTSAAAGAGQTLTMKIYRQVSGMTYMVVGHDGPQPLTPGVVNTFPTNIAVQANDVLGLNDANAMSVTNACDFTGPGTRFAIDGDLADGQSAVFTEDVPNNLNNVTAVFEAAPATPTSLTAGPTGQRAAALTKCKKKGKQKHWTKKKLKKCKRKTKLLPV